MCELDRRTFLKAVPGAAVLAGEFVYGRRAHAQGAPLKIGAPLPLTGPAAPLGQHSLWGTQTALRLMESKGGIAGRQVQLIVEDDGGRPADAVKIMRKMILQDSVDVIIGGASSVDTVPMLPVAGNEDAAARHGGGIRRHHRRQVQPLHVPPHAGRARQGEGDGAVHDEPRGQEVAVSLLGQRLRPGDDQVVLRRASKDGR
jgi:hypothetical protein